MKNSAWAIFGAKHFNYRQHHTTEFIQRRVHYFSISNKLLKTAKKTDILTAFTFTQIQMKKGERDYGNSIIPEF